MTIKSAGTAVIAARSNNGKIGRSIIKVGYSGDIVLFTAETFVTQKGTDMYKYMRKGDGVDWCALFASYCYDLNGALGPGKIVDQYAWNVDHFLTLPNYRSKAEFPNYVPKKGDLVIFAYPGSTNPKHVGIVKSYSNMKGRSTLKTIEGNVGNYNPYNSEVDYRTYQNEYNSTSGYQVLGYFSLNGEYR